MLPSFFDLVVWGHEHECHQEVMQVRHALEPMRSE
jgi:hypothetical protein